MKFGLLLAGLFLAGCASTMAKIIPVGEPVTKERCEKLDMKKIGFDDGEVGHRNGDKFEYWTRDCRPLGVNLSKETYDRGYAEGLQFYCSCEKGFSSGVHNEVIELKGEYLACSKDEYQNFYRGHELGQKYTEDSSMMKKVNVNKTDYFEDVIAVKAKTECGGDKPADKSAPKVEETKPTKS